jgi:DNA-binding winged helix-turn-helix (wHTH) protein
LSSASYRFGRFVLDPHNRQLTEGGAAVDINARYLDALTLLVREHGKLISKERFLEEVWRGVPVTDEALTQCVKTLRKVLGDEASSPRFIETVPKHGYRFIAQVEAGDGAAQASAPSEPATAREYAWRRFWRLGAAGVIGGGAAGFFGGLFYGFGGAADSAGGTGAASVVLVLVSACVLIGLLAGAGVGFGIAGAGHLSKRDWGWGVIGGAAGGFVVGALVKLIGLDAFAVLFGQSPAEITGAGEGALLGGAVGLTGWLAHRYKFSLRRSLALAAVAGAAAGAIIALLGGRLMGGSLDVLARHFPTSRLQLDQIGALFGEPNFGPITHTVTCGLEGALFSVCVVGALMLAHERIGSADGTRTRSSALKAQNPNP